MTANSIPANASLIGAFRFDDLAAATYTVTPYGDNVVFYPSNTVAQVGPDIVNLAFKAYQLNALAAEHSGDTFRLIFAGNNGQTIRLLSSTNLFEWSVISTNVVGPSRLVEFFDEDFSNTPFRYYKIISP